MTVNRPWTVVVAAKRAIRDAQLRKYETADESLGSELCGTGMVDVEALTTLLRSGQLSAEDVIRAFIRR